MPAKILSAILLLIVPLQVRADYQLQVTVHRFTIDVTCDNILLNVPNCDVFFSICQRALVTPIDSSNADCPEGVTSETQRNVDPFVNYTFSEPDDLFFGLSNPIILKGSEWVGVQFYMLVIDDDSTDEDDLIDILAIDINIPVGESIDRTTYTGQRDNTHLDLSFRVVCAPNYYGPNCSRFCNDTSCPCDPGFTGEFCETEVNINICDSINCNNGYCENRTTNSYTCVCDPGFTGEFCEKTIEPLNETASCEIIGCSGNGECLPVDSLGGITTYECHCDPAFSGKSCENGQDSELKDSSNNNYLYGAIIGGVFGAVVLMVILIAVVTVAILALRHKSNKKMTTDNGPQLKQDEIYEKMEEATGPMAYVDSKAIQLQTNEAYSHVRCTTGTVVTQSNVAYGLSASTNRHGIKLERNEAYATHTQTQLETGEDDEYCFVE